MSYEKKRISVALEEIYKTYPKKLGKSPGIRKGLATVKSDDDVRDLSAAVRNYRKFLKDNFIDPKYTMYFSTFMNQWRDWIDAETGKTDLIADFAGQNKIDYNEMSRSIWHWLNGQGSLNETTQDAVNKIGANNIRQLHRDDFRPNGQMPGLIKKALETA